MAVIPGSRIRYLAEISEQGRAINASVHDQADAANRLQHYHEALKALDDHELPDRLDAFAAAALTADNVDTSVRVLRQRYQEALQELTAESVELLKSWPERRANIRSDQYRYEVRGKEVTGSNYYESLSHQRIPKIAAPTYGALGELLTFLLKENLPGAYPYTGGVYPYRRLNEDPTRMFAGEGTPERTNRRFHYLSRGQEAARLSTAFDSVTLTARIRTSDRISTARSVTQAFPLLP
jgi:isobutyryl-CoA mutase